MRIAIIGAGCSGLTAIKHLIEAGIEDVICYEKTDQIGGNWVYTATPSHSSISITTHTISSKPMSQFSDFPMPPDYPDYPSHQQILAYFQAYAQHFQLEQYIRFQIAVLQVHKIQNERWRLTLSDGTQPEFDFLLVANGHLSNPRHPDWKKISQKNTCIRMISRAIMDSKISVYSLSEPETPVVIARSKQAGMQLLLI